MAGQLPLRVQRLVSLGEEPLNLPTSSFRYGSVSVESDQFVCVKDVAADGSNQVVVVDLHNENRVLKRPTKKADAALMHTRDNIIVLRGRNDTGVGHFIQIFNLDTKTKLLDHKFDNDIVFWKWINATTLGVITVSTVWHCSIDGTTPPERVFERAGRLADNDVQVINYAADEHVKWCLLAAISSGKDRKSIDGHLQLYSVDRKQQQFLEGHAGCFGTLATEEGKAPIPIFSFAERKDGVFKLHVMDVYTPRSEGLPQPLRVSAEFKFPPEARADFPLFEYLSPQHGVVYLLSRGGYVLVLDALSGTTLMCQHISKDAVFVACPDRRSGGCICVNRKGEVLSVAVNEQALVPFIQQNRATIPNAAELTMSLVRRYGFPGCDDVLVQAFNAAFQRGDYAAAARIAAITKSGALRNSNTINRFKSAPAANPSPTLTYFSTLLDLGKLNAAESLELVRPVVAQKRTDLITRWLADDRLECTEALGDLVRPLDPRVALQIFEQGRCGQRVLQCLVESGQYDKIVPYAKKTQLAADYVSLLRNMLALNPAAATDFAKQLLAIQPPLADVNAVVESFVQQSRLQEVTSVLLEYLKDNRPEHAALQTRLLELNLTHAPKIAETIFQMGQLTYFDRNRVAQLCEKAGLPQRALEFYSDHADVKRVLSMQGASAASQLSPEWLTGYFGKLPPETALECLSDFMRANRGNMQLAVQIAIQHHATVGTDKVIALFEQHNSYEGLFFFLRTVHAFSADPTVHFKYIEAASKVNQFSEVERMCKESQHLDAVAVKQFLKEARLQDPRPLIYLCDRFDFVQEMAEYLYHQQKLKYIEVYCTRLNPSRTPEVVGVLLDVDCPEEFIKQLLDAVRGACPAAPLVEEVEKRNRLRVVLPWLEARAAEGNTEACLHNALAKVYIDTNHNAEEFLLNNPYYDPKAVGAYCEDRDPHLAYTAYKKHWGTCDAELLRLTNANGLFRLQARYLVERQNLELWAVVLSPDNEFRRAVVDQVVGSALPESTSADEVTVAVRAFMAADLPNELMELLEKIVLHNTEFSSNRNLQNLLLLTAVRSDHGRVMEYASRLENFEGPEIAQVALEHKLYEEAVAIYQKCNMQEQAIGVVIEHLEDLDRASELAAKASIPAVWTTLGNAFLQRKRLSEAVDAFLNAQDPSSYKEVIALGQQQEQYADLVRFLQMARKQMRIKDSLVDTELIFVLAKSGRMQEMEDLVGGANTANVQIVADRLCEGGFYPAAKTLYANISNYAKLAACHIRMEEWAQALEAARKGNSPKTWKDLNIACVQAGEFRVAHNAGIAVIGHADHLEEIVNNYEKLGHFNEMIALLEAGVNSEKAPVALFSELGVAYSKFRPEKLGAFLRSNNFASGRLNIPKLIRSCERHELWRDVVYLYTTYREYDQACSTMMKHSSAFVLDDFLLIVQKVTNTELLYRACKHFLEYEPMSLNAMLVAVVDKLDHSRVIDMMRKAGHLQLIEKYLEHVQGLLPSVPAVNTALNEIYLENESCEALRRSITECPAFDQLGLARRLEEQELLELQRLAGVLYRQNKMFSEAIALAKKNHSYGDAIQAAAESESEEVAESLLRYFILEIKDREAFAACLATCYKLIKPDVVLELAWRTGSTDEIMPFMIQTFRTYAERLEAVEKKLTIATAAADQKKTAVDYSMDFMVPSGNAIAPFGALNGMALLPASTIDDL